MREETFSCLGSGTVFSMGELCCNPAKEEGSEQALVTAALTSGGREQLRWLCLLKGPPFFSSLPFLLPGVVSFPHNCEAAAVVSCTGKTGLHMCPCQHCQQSRPAPL